MIRSNELDHKSLDLVLLLGITYNLIKKNCVFSIKIDYLYINKTKNKKDQIKNISNTLLCKNKFVSQNVYMEI